MSAVILAEVPTRENLPEIVDVEEEPTCIPTIWSTAVGTTLVVSTAVFVVLSLYGSAAKAAVEHITAITTTKSNEEIRLQIFDM